MQSERNIKAVKLAIQHYGRQILRDWKISFPALLLPGLGNILIFFLPPIIVAHILYVINTTAHASLSQFWPYVILFVLLWGFGEIVWRIAIHLLIKTETRGMQRLYTNAMDEMFKKDTAFLHDNFAGSLTKRVVNYAKNFEGLMDTLTFNVFSDLLPIPVVIIVLGHYSPWLVIVLLALLAVTVVLILPLIKRRQKRVALREASSNVMAGHVADVISNMDTVQAFAHEDVEAVTTKRYVKDYVAKAKDSWDYQNLRIDMMTSPFYVLTNSLGLIAALVVGNNNPAAGSAVFLTFSYYSQVTRVMFEFNHIYRNLESSITEGAQFTELLLDEAKVRDLDHPQDFKVTEGAIEMARVNFRYSDNKGEHLLKNFDLNIDPSEKVALVGHSGSGKTTITKLLLRLMDIDAGEILIDGQNIAQIRQRDLRSSIAYVPQEPAMFHRSIMENIRYGRLDATDAEVKRAAKLAYADEFIDKLPEGYATMVGERGVKLSGGQRQRVAIARAILKNAPILIFDEATSSLDSESEKLIQAALWKLMEGRTVIVVAHRLSTIQRMDRIVVLEDGEIVEQGSHKQLLELKNGTYARLWAHQSGGFLED